MTNYIHYHSLWSSTVTICDIYNETLLKTQIPPPRAPLSLLQAAKSHSPITQFCTLSGESVQLCQLQVISSTWGLDPCVYVKVWNHFVFLSMFVMFEHLGVLVPEVVMHHLVQQVCVEIHVFLWMELVWYCSTASLNHTLCAQNFYLVYIKMFLGVSTSRVDDNLVNFVRDAEVVN